MNRVLEELRRGDSRVFDRLADGELSPADQRALLAALDDEPGAWRRCALALVEAQVLRRSSAPGAMRPRLRPPSPNRRRR